MLPKASQVSMGFMLGMTVILPGYAVSVARSELSESERWVAAKFEGKVEPRTAEPYLEVQAKRGSLQENSRDGGPLRIFNKTYKRGLYMGGVQAVTVHLPTAAKVLEATVGIDGSYSGCAYTSGIQRFRVETGGNKLFESGIVRVATPGVPVKVGLGGATDFTLRVAEGAPEGMKQSWCKEAVWAEARVTLANGKSLWLGDLPIAPLPAPFTTELPFSFTYAGRSSREFLSTWTTRRSVRQLDQQRTEYETTYADPQSQLVVRWEAIAYHDYPTVEWTLYFENAGSADTPMLENLQALDTQLERHGGPEFILYHSKGSPYSPTDYQPFRTELGPKTSKRITTSGGRPTNSDLCYFNVEWQRKGLIIALGWPGQWAAAFTRDDERGLRVLVGQELTHFTLHPGEKVRTPLVALQFWEGDWIRAQNVWRQWMLVHNLPRPGAKPLSPKIAASSCPWYQEMTLADEASQKLFLDRYAQARLKIDYWWMDAGWYVNNGSWVNTGTWEVDPKRFPNGMRIVSDYARPKGIETIVWFELERVTLGTRLWEEHSDWLLKCPEQEQRGQRLLNLGNPEALKWVIETLNHLIDEQGIGVYRTDFNIDPLPFWRNNDAPDRQGITENKYVMGFLAYLDTLRQRYPNMLMDTCASGGRRNDLETLRRMVPMHRSDYTNEPVAQQNMTYGIAFWIPYYGAPTQALDDYTFRSVWCPQVNLGWDLRRKDLNFAWMRRALGQWHAVANNYFGDYYPLTSYDSSRDGLMAWQFDRPDLGQGVVQAFRRPGNPCGSAWVQLRGLEPNSTYVITDLDSPGSPREMTGRELTEKGLLLVMKGNPSSVVVTYRRARTTQ